MDANTKIIVSVNDIVAIHNLATNLHPTGDDILAAANIIASTRRILDNPEVYNEPKEEVTDNDIQ